ncbi:nicotinamide-nucleotide amidohydrolase family protein [Epilithonimonas sp.]|uniref:CinA family protein n=1 Tax=Epilithonimonas sp. TaxID=2894511 RepID=UPI00289DF464|nr:nicotinamide-nucleotide amidohydrolase family protein [Epilithonimonas sp.]
MEFSKILLDEISYYLKNGNESISTAESVTSGFLQLALSQMSDAEKIYKGGITAYTIEQKVKHLNIDHNEAKEVNCVSRHISEDMAKNVALMFDTEWSLATTGYATPVEESNHEVFAFYCIAYRGTIIRSDRIELHPMTKALEAQKYFMEYILNCLSCEVKRNFEHIDF